MFLTLFLSLGTVIVVPTSGWVINKVIKTASDLEAHKAANDAKFTAIQTTLTDLKAGQDRLIEHLLR